MSGPPLGAIHSISDADGIAGPHPECAQVLADRIAGLAPRLRRSNLRGARPLRVPAIWHGRRIAAPAMFGPLRYRDYRFYWLGQFPAVLAQNMQFVALAWLVLQLTNSPAMLGIN